MKLLGYIVTIQDNWVVKKYEDGKVVRIKEIEK
jgi:hypothetical protein